VDQPVKEKLNTPSDFSFRITNIPGRMGIIGGALIGTNTEEKLKCHFKTRLNAAYASSEKLSVRYTTYSLYT
jgi:hypothetical protein